MPVDPVELSELMQIVGLLTAGHTDAAIGKRLGLSERTVRRRVARLLSVIQAKSRFQAGVMLARGLPDDVLREPPPAG